MARYKAVKNDEPMTYQITKTQRNVLIIGLVAFLFAAFLLGFFLGKGQKKVTEVIEEQPNVPLVVQTPSEPEKIPIQPLDDTQAKTEPEPVTPETTSPPPEDTIQPKSSSEPQSSSAKTVQHPVEQTPAQPQKKPLTPGTKWEVQLFALKNAERARKWVSLFRQKGFPSYTVPGPDHTIRVRLGPFSSKAEAQSALERLKQNFPQLKNDLKRAQIHKIS